MLERFWLCHVPNFGPTMLALFISLRVFVGMVLLLFGVAKALQAQSATVAHIDGYKLLSPRFAAITAATLPGVEIAMGALMITGVAAEWAAMCAASLFLVFALASVSALRRGLTNECGCGGALSASRVRPALVYRDLGLALVSGVSGILGPREVLPWHLTTAIISIMTLLVIVHALLRIHSARIQAGCSKSKGAVRV